VRQTRTQLCSNCVGTGGDLTNMDLMARWKCSPCNGTGSVTLPLSDSEMLDLIWERLNNLASSPCPCRSGEVASNPPAIAADGAGKEGE